MNSEHLLTLSKIENINQMIADLYNDSVLLDKRMEEFFTHLNSVVFFEKANFLFFQKQGQTYETHSIYTINWTDLAGKALSIAITGTERGEEVR